MMNLMIHSIRRIETGMFGVVLYVFVRMTGVLCNVNAGSHS